MAARTFVLPEYDIAGPEVIETVSFALDNISYEIDLSAENAAKLREDLVPYIKAVEGRPRDDRQDAKRTTRSTPRRASSHGRSTDPQSIRAWAREQGLAVSTRGRISQKVQDAYAAAQ